MILAQDKIILAQDKIILAQDKIILAQRINTLTLTLAIAICPDIYLVGTLDILQRTRPVYKWVVQDCRMAIRHMPITIVRVLGRDKYNTNNTERQVILS